MSYIKLSNGERHYFGQPFTPGIECIAFALSNINRFAGQVGQYSVAQHCVLVAQQLPDELKRSGLLHDSPEAYLGDVSAPLKALLPDYKLIEQRYHDVVDAHFEVDTKHELVKGVDLRMRITEAQYFGLWERDEWPNVQPFHIPDFKPMPAKFAERAFLAMFEELTS